MVTEVEQKKMRLIVHMGMHKTASTFLQHILNDNHLQLSQQHIYYEPQEGYPAHHHAAWTILGGDMTPLIRMVASAKSQGCDTVILSSEDLEGLLASPALARGIASTAADLGIHDIEWHVFLREPGAYFQSLFAQLQHHVYADSLALFVEVMRRGLIFMPDPHLGEEGTPFWAYCFDQEKYLAKFEQSVAGKLVVHDYRDNQPFPGWRLLDGLGALDAVEQLPGKEARNERLSPDAVLAGYFSRVAEALGPDTDASPALCSAVEQALMVSTENVPVLAEAVSTRFAESHAQALRRVRYPAALDPD